MKPLFSLISLAILLLSHNSLAQDVSLQQKLTVRQRILDTQQLSEAARSLGTWTGGGGEGVVCFKSPEAKERAFDHQGKLRNEFRSEIRSVYAYDLVEYKNELLPLSSFEYEKPADYLYRVIARNVEPASPYFARRLREAIALIVSAEGNVVWEDQGAQIRLTDAGERRVHIVSPECALSQVVVRYSRKSSEVFPQFFMDYDQHLFDLMAFNGEGIVHQAALILHEALYLAGYSLGITTSAGIRGLVAHILWMDLPQWLDAAGETFRQGRFTTILYSHGMRDATRLFLDESEVRHPYSKQSRQWARAELARKYQEVWEDLFLKSPRLESCMEEYTVACDQVFIPMLAKSLTDEEAFLFLTATAGNDGYISFTVDQFLIEGVDDDQAGRTVCKLFSDSRGELRHWTSMTDKGLHYCSGWGKSSQ